MLCLTSLFWAGNVVAGRLAVGEVSPMAITCLRWLISFTLLYAIQHRRLAEEWPQIVPRWRLLLVMSVFGYSSFNALFYLAASHTTGVNLAILQGSMPIFILAGALAFSGARIGPIQSLGVAMALTGVVAVAARGDVSLLAQFSFNIGDVLTLLACFLYAIYALMLPRRPKVSALSFLTTLAAGAALSSIPLLAGEYAMGLTVWPSAKGWLIIAYIAVFPSLLAQICFIRGVELIGPARAGVFTNLVPVMGALLSVAILHEGFGLYHAVAMILIVGGIIMVEKYSQTRRKAALDAPVETIKVSS